MVSFAGKWFWPTFVMASNPSGRYAACASVEWAAFSDFLVGGSRSSSRSGSADSALLPDRFTGWPRSGYWPYERGRTAVAEHSSSVEPPMAR